MKESPKEKKFMRQKVVKPPVDKRRVIRRFFILLLRIAPHSGTFLRRGANHGDDSDYD